MTISKKLFRTGPYADFYSQAVQVVDSIFLSGQVGIDDAGTVPSDLLSQMSLAYKNIETILMEYGASLDNIVDETWFVTDINDCMAQMPALFSAREKFFGKKPEVCQTLVQVTGLVDPSLKIEIKCIAISG